MFALLVSMLFSLPQTAAHAAVSGVTDLVGVNIVRTETGTGQGTGNGCGINAANGFTPGDETAADQYICSFDTYKFNAQVTVATGEIEGKYRLTYRTGQSSVFAPTVMDPTCRAGANGAYTGVIVSNVRNADQSNTYVCDITVPANTSQLLNIPAQVFVGGQLPNGVDVTPTLTVAPIAPTAGPTMTSEVTDANRVVVLSQLRVDMHVSGQYTSQGAVSMRWANGPAAGDGTGIFLDRMAAAPLNARLPGSNALKGSQLPVRTNDLTLYFDLSAYPDGTKVYNCGTVDNNVNGYTCTWDPATKILTQKLNNTNLPIALINVGNFWNDYYGTVSELALPEFSIFIPKASLPDTSANWSVNYPIKVSSTQIYGAAGQLNFDADVIEPGGTPTPEQPVSIVCATDSGATTPPGLRGGSGFANGNCRADSFTWNSAINSAYGVPFAARASGPVGINGSSHEWDEAPFTTLAGPFVQQNLDGTVYFNGYEAGTPVWHVARINGKELIAPNLLLCNLFNPALENLDTSRAVQLFERATADGTLRPVDPTLYKVQYTNVAVSTGTQRCGSSTTNEINGGSWYDSSAAVPGGSDAINAVRFVMLQPYDMNTSFPGADKLMMYVPAKPRPIGDYTLDTYGFTTTIPSIFDFTTDASSATPTYAGGATQAYRNRDNNLGLGYIQQAHNAYGGSNAGTTVPPGGDMRINFWMHQVNPTYDQLEIPQVVMTLDNCVSNPRLPVNNEYWSIEYVPAVPGPSGFLCGATDATPGKVTITSKVGIPADRFPVSTFQSQNSDPLANRNAHPIYLDLTVSPAAENDRVITNTSTLQDVATPYSIQVGGTPASASTIRVVTATAATVSKTTLTPQLEVRSPDEITWVLNYYNGVETSAGRTQFIDRFPFNGDPRGSSFSGDLNITSIRVGEGATATVEYTKLPPLAISNDPADPTNAVGGATVWCDSFTAGGTCPAAIGEVTAMRVTIPDFTPQMRGGLVVTAKPTAPENGDVFINQTGAAVGDALPRPIPATAPVTTTIVASTISGRIFDDADGSKAFNEPGDTGLGGVTVQVLNEDGTPYLIDGVPVTTTTAADGTYTVGNLTAGNYRVKVLRDGELPADAVNTVAPAFPTANSTDPTDTSGVISVALGETAANTDFGFALPKTGSLTVTGTGADTGTGGDGATVNGVAAVGETVNTTFTVTNTGTAVADGIGLESPYGGGTQLVPVPGDGYTIVDGKVNGLQPGATVNFVLEGVVTSPEDATAGAVTVPATVSGTFQTTPGATPTPIPTTPDMTASVTVPAAVAVNGALFTDTNGNGVRDAGEAPLEGVTVNVLNAEGVSVGTVTTGADGAYDFTDLPAGSYRVQATAPTGQSFTTQSTDPASTTESQADANGLTPAYVLAAGETRADALIGVVPVAAPALTVTGGIEDLGDNGNTVNNVAAVGETVRKTYTITNTGNVTLTDVKPTVDGTPTTADGSTSVTLAPGESATFTVDEVVTPEMVAVANGQPGADVGNILAPVSASGQPPTPPNSTEVPPVVTAVAPTDRIPLGGTVTGQVWDDANFNGVRGVDEAPKAGVTVELRAPDGIVVATTVTGADGTYSFTEVPAGDLVVHVTPAAGDVFTTPGVGTDTSVDSDVAPSGDTAVLTLTPGGLLGNVDAGVSTGGMPEQPSTGIQGVVQTVTPELVPDDPAAPLDPKTTTIAPPANVPPGVVYTPNEDGTVTVTNNNVPVGVFDTVKNPDGTPTGDISFTPDPQFVGEAPPIVVTQTDGNDTPTSILVTPTVTPVTPTVPTITEATGPQGEPVPIDPLFEAGDPEVPLDVTTTTIAPPATVPPGVVYTPNADGSITVVKDGTPIGVFAVAKDEAGVPTGDIVFTPEEKFVGEVPPVTATQRDANDTPAVTEIRVTITPVTPTAPPGGTDVETPQGTPISATPVFTPGSPDVPMDPKTTAITPPATVPPGVVYTPNEDGTITVTKDDEPVGVYTPGKDADGNPDGTVDFTPDPNFIGPVPPVTVTQADDNGTVVTSTLNPTVTPLPPIVLEDETSTGLQGKTQQVNVSDDATGANGIKGSEPGTSVDPTTTQLIDATGNPTTDPVPAMKDGVQVGVYQLVKDAAGVPTGSIQFVPNPDFVGTPTPVGFTVGDVNGETSNVGQYTPTVTAVTPGTPTDELPSTGVQTQNQVINPEFVPGDPTVPMDPKTTAIVPPATVPTGVVYTSNPDGSLTVVQDGVPVGVFTPVKDAAGDPTGEVTFTPDKDFIGVVPPVVVTQADVNGTEVPVTVNATVTPGVPVAVSDNDNVSPQGVPVVIPVTDLATGANGVRGFEPDTSIDPALTRLIDAAGAPTTDPVPAVKDGVTVGSWSLGVTPAGEPDGTIVFTPNKDFVGDTPTTPFVVGDVNGNTSEQATVAAQISAVTPTGPVDEATSTGPQNTPQNIAVPFTPGDPLVPMDVSTTSIQPPATVVPGEVYTSNPDGSITVTRDGLPIGTFTVGVNAAGVPDGSVVFTPERNFIGVVPVIDVAQDDVNGTQAVTPLTVTVTPVAPTTGDDNSGTGPQGVPQRINVVDPSTGGNDLPGTDPGSSLDPTQTRLVDAEGNPTLGPVPALKDNVPVGTWTVGVGEDGQPDGTIVFTPNPEFVGTVDPTPFIVGDVNGLVSEPTPIIATTTPVTPTGPETPVESTNDQGVTQTFTPVFVPGVPEVPMDPKTTAIKPPVTVPPGVVYEEQPDGSITVSKDGTPIGSFVPVKDPSGTPTGDISFTPNPNFVGEVPPIVVTQEDENGTIAETEVSPTVTPVPPVATDVTSTGPQGVKQTLSLLPNTTGANQITGDQPGSSIDPVLTRLVGADGQPTVDPVDAMKDGVKVGVFTLVKDAAGNPTGSVEFTPNATFTGTTDPVQYTVSDTNGLTSTPANLTPTVTPVTPMAPEVPVTSTGDQDTKQTVTPEFVPGNPDVPMDPKTTAIKPPADVPPGVVYTPNPDGTITVTKDDKPVGVYRPEVDDNGDPTGDITFDPDPGFTGTAPPIVITQKDTNGTLIETPWTPSVTRTTPETTPVTGTGDQGVPVTVDVLKGSTDANGIAGSVPGNTLDPTATRLLDAAGNPTLLPVPVMKDGKQIGVFTLDQTDGKPNGKITFTPAKTFVGEAPPVQFIVGDKNGKVSPPATFTPTIVAVTPGAPSLDDQPPATEKNTPVTYTPKFTAGSPDVPMDPKTTAIKPPADVPPGVVYEPQPDGSIKVSKDNTPIGVFTPGKDTNGDPDGTVKFTPDPNFTGSVPPIVITQKDTNGTEAEVPWAPRVLDPAAPAGSKIQARPDYSEDYVNVTQFVKALANDTGANGVTGEGSSLDAGALQLSLAGNPSVGSTSGGTSLGYLPERMLADGKTLLIGGVGTLTVQAAGTVQFVPLLDYTGQTQANYTISDLDGQTVGTTIDILVKGPGAPTAPKPGQPGVPTQPGAQVPLLGNLAKTGADVAPYLAFFGLLTAAGALLIAASRRRNKK